MTEKKPLRVAVAGLGTVGGGVVKVLQKQADLLKSRCGRAIELVAVSSRSKGKRTDLDLSGISWIDNPIDLAHESNIDVIIETIGGDSGIALDLTRAALTSGKAVITANKAMLAKHGTGLAKLADQYETSLHFEASVAGGIPIVKRLREGLAANRLSHLYGILNGTCNYILTQMEKTGASFQDVLSKAQALGYAEVDPTLDVGGHDAAHKLSILAAVAFGMPIRYEGMYVEGITEITKEDIQFARELGYRIKLLGLAGVKDGSVDQRVHPCMISLNTPIADVGDVFNAVVVEGDFVGQSLLTGRGAGEGPTASAVVADLIDVARGIRLPVFGVPLSDLQELTPLDMGEHRGQYYIRLGLKDQSGAIASVTNILASHNISIQSMIQRGRSENESVPVVIVTHEAKEADIQKALKAIDTLPASLEKGNMIRIVHFC
jgi:homoserine dehydrogenase